MVCLIVTSRHNFNSLKRKETMNSEVENFMYYMYNRWCLDEAHLLFGKSLGDHIYEKWNKKVHGEWPISRLSKFYE